MESSRRRPRLEGYKAETPARKEGRKSELSPIITGICLNNFYLIIPAVPKRIPRDRARIPLEHPDRNPRAEYRNDDVGGAAN